MFDRLRKAYFGALDEVDGFFGCVEKALERRQRFFIEVGRCLFTVIILWAIFYGIPRIHYLTPEEVEAMRQEGRRLVAEQSR